MLFIGIGLVAATHPVTSVIAHSIDVGVLNLLRFSIAVVIFLPPVRWRYELARPSALMLAEAALSALTVVGLSASPLSWRR